MKKILPLLLLLALLSCSKEDEQIVDAQPHRATMLTIAAMPHGNSSRGALIEKDTMMSTVGLFGTHTGDDMWSDTCSFSDISNIEFRYQNNNWECATQDLAWNNATPQDRYTFYGYSPFATSENGIAAEIIEGKLSINYTIPEVCKNQPDLMIAAPQKDIYKPSTGRIPLEFYHTLASLEFNIRGMGHETIKKISISGVSSSAALTWEGGAPLWGGFSEVDDTSFSAVVDSSVAAADGATSTVTTWDGYIMMIPQDIAADQVTVSVTYIDASGTRTKTTLTIPATKWEMNKIYSYTISFDDDGGGGAEITQTSNCYIIDPSNVGMSYYIPIDSHANKFWGSEGYSPNPDNVIAVTDGVARAGDGSAIGAAVVMYDCANINNFEVDIVSSGFSPTKLTQSNITTRGGDFADIDCTAAMKVTLNGKCKAGNVVVAVYKDVNGDGALAMDDNGEPLNGDEIVWTWHLWFTNYAPDQLAKIHQSEIVDDEIAYYEADKLTGVIHRYRDVETDTDVWASADGVYAEKFMMDRNIGATSVYTLGQGDGENYSCGVLYYQHGRKDPFAGVGAHYLDSSGGYSIRTNPPTSKSSQSISSTMNHPTTFSTSEVWYSDNLGAGESLWCGTAQTGDTDSYGTKSLFDPSPLGWRVPLRGVWSDFDGMCFIWNGSDKNRLGRFYPQHNDSPFTPFYSATGYRDYTTSECSVGASNGSYWSSTVDADNIPYRLFFNKGGDAKINSQAAPSYGHVVRPVQE